MDLGKRLEESLRFITVFSFQLFGREIRVTETVAVSWAVMAVLIGFALIIRRNLRPRPQGLQCLVEAGVEFLNTVSKRYFGRRAHTYGPYIGTLFLFLLLANCIPAITPIGVFGREPPFKLKPPSRDINFTAAAAVITIAMVLIGGIRARGLRGWAKTLIRPSPVMLPFNIMDYAIRPISLSLRLFGNMLGGFIIMVIIETVAPIGVPAVLSLYFDFFDGVIQALVFTFLTVLFVSEAVEAE
ncbi:MAG: F0F1 ATP synthase subunit A [Treponema sp.]|jgi:F-type H+-transporting ATPase subunit a|nr:F0F1 ATP synthase subunit A [Treponema sp.]